jgi:hypothetical protein
MLGKTFDSPLVWGFLTALAVEGAITGLTGNLWLDSAWLALWSLVGFYLGAWPFEILTSKMDWLRLRHVYDTCFILTFGALATLLFVNPPLWIGYDEAMAFDITITFVITLTSLFSYVMLQCYLDEGWWPGAREYLNDDSGW